MGAPTVTHSRLSRSHQTRAMDGAAAHSKVPRSPSRPRGAAHQRHEQVHHGARGFRPELDGGATTTPTSRLMSPRGEPSPRSPPRRAGVALVAIAGVSPGVSRQAARCRRWQPSPNTQHPRQVDAQQPHHLGSASAGRRSNGAFPGTARAQSGTVWRSSKHADAVSGSGPTQEARHEGRRAERLADAVVRRTVASAGEGEGDDQADQRSLSYSRLISRRSATIPMPPTMIAIAGQGQPKSSTGSAQWHPA